ncbi:unnamed protein product [Cylicocyclus nassatus]|uniref:Uncharacterized protein n=1 Tax=Cylicocyclus nassatus TaxID=53992 RepID=A0AA36H932_CYLNA|nr:unnamed protein product [Cylicocyclus nassatus]
MYKHVWLVLEKISESANASEERLKAAAFSHVVKSLKFYKYMVFQVTSPRKDRHMVKKCTDMPSTEPNRFFCLRRQVRRINCMSIQLDLGCKIRPFLREHFKKKRLY